MEKYVFARTRPVPFAWLAAAVILMLAAKASSAQELVEIERHRIGDIEFRTPPGLTVERVAGSPLVERPIVATWDNAGRLVVLEAAGPIDPEAEDNGSRPHRMVRLVDHNGDGIFDQRIVAAEELRFPVGVLSLGENTLVSSPPEIWNLIDEDGDGVCERREVWFDPGTITHCRNDLHGPYLGRDGWIYWCKGAFAEQSHAEFNGQPVTSTAAHILRRRFDGGPIEAVMTGGMDNPVELAFTPRGERFFTSTFVQHPGGGRRDGIVHAIYGGVYGKPHAPLDGHLRTGPLMPIMTHLGPAAPSGLIVPEDLSLLQAAKLADSEHVYTIGDFLVATQFNLQKVSSHRLIPEGATYRTEDRDLLVADRVEFHPTDVLEDADGSLLVFDTGGWYDLCCPSSALDQTVATGGIYRVSAPELKQRTDPRGSALDWEGITAADAVERLSNPSWWIVRLAERWLERHAMEAEPALVGLLSSQNQSPALRLKALWLLCRLGTPAAQAAMAGALGDPSPDVRQAAALAIALHRWPATEPLVRLLQSDSDPAVRRAAAEALGRLRDPAAVESLLEAAANPQLDADRVLEHSILFALMEIGEPTSLARDLESPDLRRRRTALRVLSELDSELLRPAAVLSALRDPDRGMRDLAVSILQARPQWSAELSPELEPLWKTAPSSDSDRAALLAVLGAWFGQPEMRQQLTEKLQGVVAAPWSVQALVADALEAGRATELPHEWSPLLAAWLTDASTPASIRAQILRWLDPIRLDPAADRELIESLLAQAESHSEDPSQLIAYVRALPDQAPLSKKTIESLLKVATKSKADPVRSSVIQLLPQLSLSAEQGRELMEEWPVTNASDATALVTAIARIGDDSLDESMLCRLQGIYLGRSIPQDVLLELYRHRNPELLEYARQIAAFIAKPPVEIGEALEELTQRLPEGDPLRGMQVFRTAPGNCSVCHQVAYVGGTTGPDLSRIGATRTGRELLEAIAYPNLRLEQSYRSVKLITADGKTYNGLIEREDSGSLDLVTGPDQRVRLAIDEIDERLPSEVSVMPSGMAEQLTPQQLADLIAFLESRR